jgi:hypothetical protein
MVMMARIRVWTAVPPIMPAHIPCKKKKKQTVSAATKRDLTTVQDAKVEERCRLGLKKRDVGRSYQDAQVEEPAE